MQHEAQQGGWTQDTQVKTSAEMKCRVVNWLNHTDAPQIIGFFFKALIYLF